MRLNLSSISLLPPATHHAAAYRPTVAVRCLTCHVEPCVVLRSRCVARYCAAVVVRHVVCCVVLCVVQQYRGVSHSAIYRAVVALRCATRRHVSCRVSHAGMSHAAMCRVSHAGV